ncbi:MAG: CopG family transcriptional regulator [Clostridia bacterium]|nr:CopG family transcriptional regulator [Clostridia bacterium]
MNNRTGVVAIVVTEKNSVMSVQTVMTTYGDVIIGRMGVPNHATGRNVIALIVEGQVDRISALVGSLGRIQGVTAKSVLTPAE